MAHVAHAILWGMPPASNGEPFSTGVSPYPAPGRPEQSATTSRQMPVSSIVVITVCVLVEVAALITLRFRRAA